LSLLSLHRLLATASAMSVLPGRLVTFVVLVFSTVPVTAKDGARRFYDDWCGGRKVEFCTTSITAIVARPELFLGRRVSVSGYLRRLYDQWAIFPTLTAACHWQQESAIEIVHVSGPKALLDFQRIEGDLVYVYGEVGRAESRPYDIQFLLSLRVGDPPHEGVRKPIRPSGFAMDTPPPEARQSDSAPMSKSDRLDWRALCLTTIAR